MQHLTDKDGWSTSLKLEIGDTYTMAGLYRKRTFKQWLARKPRVLQVYKITGVVCSNN